MTKSNFSYDVISVTSSHYDTEKRHQNNVTNFFFIFFSTSQTSQSKFLAMLVVLGE